MSSPNCFHDDNSEEEYLSAKGGSDSDDSQESLHCENGLKRQGEDFGVNGNTLKQFDIEDVKDYSHVEEVKEENNSHEEEIEDDEEERTKMEQMLSVEEKEAQREASQKLKDEGNAKFRLGEYQEAVDAYTEALSICPLTYLKERSIMFSNRAACKMKEEKFEAAIQDSSQALKLHPTYLKALLRRAELYEQTEKLDESLADYQKVLELDHHNGMARAACMRLPQQIKDRNDKMKEEMMDKLKDLGNLVLRPFGLSTNNFKLQQDEATGSYSVQFQQNPPGNGT